MNAPQAVPRNSAVLVQALGRLRALLTGQEWEPPHLPLDQPRLMKLASRLQLGEGELLAVALLYAVEVDPSVARAVAQVQSPVAGARCMSGLLASLFARDGVTVAGLWAGSAAKEGLIVWDDEEAPLPERTVHMPPHLAAALNGLHALPPGLLALTQPKVVVPEDASRGLADVARALFGPAEDIRDSLLVIRGQCPAEIEQLSAVAAAAIGRTPYRLENPDAPGLALWLDLAGGIPVLAREAGPGEAIDLGSADRIDAPIILVASNDGHVVSARPTREWRASIPSAEQRRELWQRWGLSPDAAARVAARYRQSAGRIAEVGRSLGSTGAASTVADVTAIMGRGGGRIDALARLSTATVARQDIVLPADLASSLDRLRDRILMRNGLADGLGPTLAARYRPGVRALFTGESGTGKTLAAHWLANEAGLPLYRVDLSAMTSKWIGETEKNISTLLDTAEHGDVLLFFDEADSLFGSRTDVSDAHDRHANAQTNFLLQRIEDYTGVAILATNSRDRFDAAFARRLDMVLEFPLPDAAARRQLWDHHLGSGHVIAPSRLDQIAAAVDLAGGHVRNVVLAAAARARTDDRPIAACDLDAAIEEEYTKLGRTAPPLAPG